MPEATEVQTEHYIGGYLQLNIGGIDIVFSASNIAGAVSSYSAEVDFSGRPAAFSEFLGALLPGDAPSFLASIRPQTLAISIQVTKGKGVTGVGFVGKIEIGSKMLDIVVVSSKDGGQNSNFLFYTRLKGAIQFQDFPLVGEYFPEKSGLDDLMISYATKPWRADIHRLLDDTRDIDTPAEPQTIAAGLSYGMLVRLGELGDFPLAFSAAPSSKDKPTEQDKEEPQNSAPAEQSVQKKASGGLKLNGLKMVSKDGRIGVIFNASLEYSAFELALMGMEVTVPQEAVMGQFEKLKEVKFNLQGLGLDIRKGPLTISGAFLRSTLKDKNGEEYDDYSGMVSVGFKAFQLAGIGSYAKHRGTTSLFLFAYLGFPMGGPPPFFVTGLALGFGINRNFIPPTIDKVIDFPLIKISTPQAAAAQQKLGIAALMTDLQYYIPFSKGDYFLVAGINFESFKIVSTQALLAVKFGNDLEVTLLGVSRMSFPAVNIELMFMAQFIPSEGIFMARGQLTENSYIFHRSVRLTGGFAVGFWFSGPHAGDFVISIGGYHPDFRPPAHYPTNIPRLGINWQISSSMSLVGEMYFALTPQAIMAGIMLKATFDSGWLYAYLCIKADFIVYWKPFFYDVSISIAVAVRATIGKGWLSVNINMSIEAGLKIWGPDFSGIAYLDLGIKTFKLEFGAGASRNPNPITWEEFKKEFIPAKPLTLSVSAGLLGKLQMGDKEILLVNAKEMTFISDSVIPATKVDIGSVKAPVTALTIGNNPSTNALKVFGEETANTQFGVSPMFATSFDATHSIIVERQIGENKWESAISEIKYKSILKNLPKALWGQGRYTGGVSGASEGIVKNLLAGFECSPGEEAKSDATKTLDADNLAYTLEDKSMGNMPQSLFPKMTQPPSDQPLHRGSGKYEVQNFMDSIGLSAKRENDIFDEKEKAFQFYTNPLVLELTEQEEKSFFAKVGDFFSRNS